MKTAIALIDDETAHAVYYQLALEARGYAVEHFKSPASFLTRARQAKSTFGLFVTDLMMPPRGAYSVSQTRGGLLTGLLLVHDIRQLDREAPILIITNVNISNVLEEVKAVVAQTPNVFLARKAEYPPDELAASVDALLTNKPAFQEAKRVGIIRRFFNSLLLRPNFFGMGLDLKRLVERSE